MTCIYMASWLLATKPICSADSGSARPPGLLGPLPRGGDASQAGAGRRCYKFLCLTGKLSLLTALHADGGHGEKQENSSEQGVQGGEGSSRAPGAFTSKAGSIF